MDKTKLKAKTEDLIVEFGHAMQRYCSDISDKYKKDALDVAGGDLSAFVEALIECAGALEVSRGQWIHSVNKEKCLSALSRLEELTK